MRNTAEEETRAEELDRKFAKIRKDKKELAEMMRNDPYINEFEDEDDELEIPTFEDTMNLVRDQQKENS
jgi:hypothetical protein